ncbi:MAG: DUF1109 domain-containing protein [Pseudomonadota bacterium]
MKTEDLIRSLAADTAQPGRLGVTLAMGLIPAAVIGLAAVWAVLGFRPDAVAALAKPVPVLRHVLTLILFATALRMCLTLARPEGRVRLWPLLLVPLAALAVVIWAYASLPPGTRAMALFGKTMVVCLVTVPLISVLPVAAILAMLRRGAVTRPTLAGALAGLAGGGLGAAIYALHCTEDSPLFYVTWYGLAILMVTAVSALIGSRLLRW